MGGLYIGIESGRIDVPNLPGDEASEDQRNDLTLEAVAEIARQLDEVEKLPARQPREAIKRLWVLHNWLEAFPAKWIRNFAKRHEWNSAHKRIEDTKIAAFRQLDEGVGQQTWDDLDYVAATLPKLHERFKVRGDVMRLILTPLGKLKHSEIRYARDDADDLPRVCTEIREWIRKTSELDTELERWGEANFGALVKPGSPPRQAPPGMVDAAGPGLAATLIGLVLAGAGAARLTGKGLESLGQTLAVGLAGVGGMLLLFGLQRLGRVLQQRSAVPKAWASLAEQFRERLYLICSLRVLDKIASRYNHANREFTEWIEAQGGKNRWKAVKFDQRDLTQVFVPNSDGWHEKETVEHWLAEEIKKAFRMDSSKLADPEELDAEAWDVILRAYLLETRSDNVDAELLDTVADLIFTRHGEDTRAERERVFDRVYKAWDEGK